MRNFDWLALWKLGSPTDLSPRAPRAMSNDIAMEQAGNSYIRNQIYLTYMQTVLINHHTTQYRFTSFFHGPVCTQSLTPCFEWCTLCCTRCSFAMMLLHIVPPPLLRKRVTSFWTKIAQRLASFCVLLIIGMHMYTFWARLPMHTFACRWCYQGGLLADDEQMAVCNNLYYMYKYHYLPYSHSVVACYAQHMQARLPTYGLLYLPKYPWIYIVIR
jgi:hypothetical protein